MVHSSRPPGRPVFFNLLQIQMPVGALTSIGHRVSGVLLAAGLPMAVYLLDTSLRDEQGFIEVIGWVHSLAFKAAAFLFVWALAHHILAGVRHLLTDISVGSTFHTARRSAWTVNLGGVVIALLLGWLWL
ncbi:MAG: succinate dehydrogenase, cytochrome b556 subunit [Rhodoferax sp.]